MTRNFERVDVSFLTQRMQPRTIGAQAIADTDFGDLNRDSIRAMNTNHDKWITFDEYIAAKGVPETASREIREGFRRGFNSFAVKIMILTGEVHTRLGASTYFVKGRKSADLCRHVREMTPVAEKDFGWDRSLRDFLLDGAFFCRGESFRSVLLRTVQDKAVMENVRRYATEVATETVPPQYLPTLLRSLITYPSDPCVHVMAAAKIKAKIKDPKLQAELMAQARKEDESAYVKEWLAGERGDDCSVGWAEFAGFLNGPILFVPF